ncbi:MAG TPA: portal protein, partial [Nitrospira sp.]|nr:portal protein [Nitrospira sp.]
KMRKLVALSTGHIGFEDELHEDVKTAIELDPSLVKRTREVEVKKIKWCKITSKDILEESEWVGKWIPVVKVIGDEVDIEGKTNLAGIIRDAKDPQRMYNYWRTAETELIALAPKAPWIMEEGQVEGHEQRWRDANNKSFPYLLYKGTSIAGRPAPPPQRQPFAGSPDGVTKAAIAAAQDMQAATGIRFDATLQERMYDESGKALRELKRVGDLGNFHYVDNLSRSLRHTGRILIDLIPKIYDTPRIITILREDDSEEQVKIDPQMGKAAGQQQMPNGKIQKLFNPKLGDYEVAVTIGPSYATKRAEAADSMMAFMKVVPQSAPIIGDLIAKNMDWPGADEIAARLHTMLPPALQAKDLNNLPVEARGVVACLQQQLQQLGQEHQKALAMLGDKEADRNVKIDKNEKDYDAKITNALVNLQKHFGDQIAMHMKSIGEQVARIEQSIESGKTKPSGTMNVETQNG